MGLPGENQALFYEKSFEEREKIDNANLDKYVEKIFGLEGNLQAAIKTSYNLATKQSSNTRSTP